MKVYLIHGSQTTGITRFNPKKASTSNLIHNKNAGSIFGSYFNWVAKYENLELFETQADYHANYTGSIYKCVFNDSDSNKPLLNSDAVFNAEEKNTNIITSIVSELFNVLPEYSANLVDFAIDKFAESEYTNYQVFNWISSVCHKQKKLSEFIDIVSKYTSGIINGLNGNFGGGSAIFFDTSQIEILEEIPSIKRRR